MEIRYLNIGLYGQEGSGSLKRQFANTSERNVKILVEASSSKSGFLLSQGSNQVYSFPGWTEWGSKEPHRALALRPVSHTIKR